MYKYVMFDFDGTLVQSKTLAIQLFNDLSPKYGYSLMNINDQDNISKLSIMERIQKFNIPVLKLPMLIREIKKLYRAHVIKLNLVDGVFELLYDLKKSGYRLGILSSNSEENIQAFLNLHRINIFDYICTSSNLFGKDKAMKKLLHEHKIQKEDILYVGDELRDMEACRKLNIDFVGVTWGYDCADLFLKHNCKHMIRAPHELYSIISSKASMT